MKLFEGGNYLLGTLSVKRGSMTQQFKLESHCWVQTTLDLYRGMCLPRFGWPLPKIYQGICMYCVTTQWPFDWRGSQEEVWACSTYIGWLKGFWNPETGLHDSPHTGLCWLHQTLFVRDGCVQGQTWGSAVPEIGQWMISPCCLW